jgi:hypothetical protein
MERDQIEESKNRTIYNAGTIAVIDSVYEEREHSSTDFPRKISLPPSIRAKTAHILRETARQCCLMASSSPDVAFRHHREA